MTKQEKMREGVAKILHIIERRRLKFAEVGSPFNIKWEELNWAYKEKYKEMADEVMKCKDLVAIRHKVTSKEKNAEIKQAIAATTDAVESTMEAECQERVERILREIESRFVGHAQGTDIIKWDMGADTWQALKEGVK